MKNASCDKGDGRPIVPEEAGADFDADEAQRLLDAVSARRDRHRPPPRVELPLPAVTAEELEQVLFRGRAGRGPHPCGRHLRPPIQCEAVRRIHQRVCDEQRRRVLLQ
ncbi:MAG: hypothetical protein ACLTG0_09305 [Oscillibacter sp.]